MSINRKSITTVIKKKLALSTVEAHAIVEEILVALEESVLTDESLNIPTFGSFHIRERANTICALNNKPIKASKTMRFHASSQLSHQLRDKNNDDYFM